MDQSIAHVITGSHRTGYEGISAFFFMFVVKSEYFMTRVDGRNQIKGEQYPQRRDSCRFESEARHESRATCSKRRESKDVELERLCPA